ncbi:MAG: dihydroorotate dehydrogenase electron transfer subunit [Bacteroidia bacterium]|nr:dihydroorotate dehydrogenase electron transfer subunit [Bacteroidia bacterium]
MKVLDFKVTYNQALNYQNNLLKVTPANNEALPDMLPGQFVQILVENSSGIFLRRPISINFVDKETNEMWLLIQQIGEGTRKICETPVGQTLNIIFPLGNSFTVPQEKGKFLLVGGGVGTAPMLFLGEKLHEKEFSPDFLLGGRSEKDLLQLNDFEKFGTVFCTTEDGSFGEKGFVTHHSVLQKNRYDFIYTCGPKPMMVAVARYAREKNIECEASLENLMACGFGACLCCIEKTTRGNLCTCTEGPVFNTNELKWID